MHSILQGHRGRMPFAAVSGKATLQDRCQMPGGLTSPCSSWPSFS